VDQHESSRNRQWQKFARELGVIVLGVLIALGAEQAVTTWHERSQMRELRVAVDNEIALGLGTWRGRAKQQACVDARLDELNRWLQGWREGKPQNLLGPISAPRSGPSGTSVWESRDPAVMTQMPLQAKLDYAGIYDSFANNEVQRLDERMTWLALGEFDGAQFLDHNAQMRLQGLITRARWRASNISNNLLEAEKVALEMGIKPGESSFEPEAYAPLCAPILPRP
jgi:hypothetical protein